ncbi:PaaI family thioesterase [Mesohalobacter halotolerans]|jgi:acyl-CoA thioesterase|uniref:Hotdog fold thioesterase n=1 Tax=Mesohalobacter halotolerans TaxID=1883405 RepID=A0A4U5TPG2_9FLAO|nr:hotdog fold thioesterase [Mesohalobacter halotolerans]MBS3739120.1 hotdog fold thioesterase [Psychroflexus sp.]NBC57946.1 hotdog fold thioesterase [Bacteroidota bacterium]TKS55856.1 hotdog fold thioesterase [Mesohalobacter halotolerans]
MSTEIPKKMLSLDPFSQWLGVEILDVKLGYCKLGLRIRQEMLNSMQKAHGGITYALADTAFGFASNTHGRFSVSIETSINHIEALHEGDYIIAETQLDINKNKLGFNYVNITCQDKIVAIFKGVVYRTSKAWQAE